MGYRQCATSLGSARFSKTVRFGSIVLLLLLFMGAVSSGTLSLTALASAPLSSQWVKTNEVPKGLTAQDWKAIQASIERDQYRFEWDIKSQTYVASNAAQGLRIGLSAQGFSVQPRASESDWSWGLTLQSYGFAPALHAVAPVSATRLKEANRLEYERGELVEWYVNERRGLEQGFTILNRPNESGGATGRLPLQVVLSLRGNLQAKQNGEGMALVDARGNTVLRYSGLVAYDAKGKALPAQMMVG
jgi:hypothetical protein